MQEWNYKIAYRFGQGMFSFDGILRHLFNMKVLEILKKKYRLSDSEARIMYVNNYIDSFIV